MKYSKYPHFNCLRTSHRTFAAGALLIVSLLSPLVSSAVEVGERLVGKVYDANTGEPLYIEEHSKIETPDQQQLATRYFDLNDKVIGERVVNYAEGKVVEYRLEQPHLGLQERIERTSEGLDIEVVRPEQRRAKQVRYKNPENIVIDAGFDDFIVSQWDTLMAGEVLRFPFASTGQLDVVYLQLKRVDANSDLLDKAGKARFEMNIANPLLRLLLDPVRIEYYAQSRTLASYRGISNIKDANQENYTVFIEFEHARQPLELASSAY